MHSKVFWRRHGQEIKVAGDTPHATETRLGGARHLENGTRTFQRNVGPILGTPVSDRPVVDAQEVVKAYRRGSLVVEALRGIDFRAGSGEIVAVVGPSGSGKTTLLNCLSGLDDIDSGRVLVEGQDLQSLSERRRTALRGSVMGFIFQAFNLIPVFSAVENVELPLLVAGTDPGAARSRAIEILNQVGLENRVNHRPMELSGGEQQRVAVARALAPQPRVVWSDEPTGNLDSVTAERILELLFGLREEGLTLVLVTHDRSIAERADRVLTMEDGRIVGEEVHR